LRGGAEREWLRLERPESQRSSELQDNQAKIELKLGFHTFTAWDWLGDGRRMGAWGKMENVCQKFHFFSHYSFSFSLFSTFPFSHISSPLLDLVGGNFYFE